MFTRITLCCLISLTYFGSFSLELAHAGPKKRKMSLAELAALEWKLEQATTTLAKNPAPKARLTALAGLAGISDPRVIKPLATALREDPSAAVRNKALALLSTFRTPEIKGLFMIAAVGDPDPAVKAAAQKALKKLRRIKPARLPVSAAPFSAPKKATIAAVDSARALPSGAARLWALENLRTAKHPKAKALLVHHLKKDPSSRLRIRAAQLLGKRGKKELPTLIGAVADGDPRVRFEVARVLSRFDDAGVLRVLQRVAANEKNPEVRQEIGDLLEPSTKVGQRLLKERIKALRSSDAQARVTALNSLSKFRNWRAMVPMSCALLSDKSIKVRKAAAGILTDMHDSSVLMGLRTAAVVESDAKLKKRVRKLLVGMRKKVDKLVRQLASKKVNERVRAARLLGQAAYGPGLAPLIKALAKDPDEKVRRAAAKALLHFSEKKAKKALKLASGDGDREVRMIIANHLKAEKSFIAWHRFYKDTNRMIAKTTDKNATWRRDAAIAIGVSGAERAAYRLIQLLAKDPDEGVRLAAAWGLVLMATDSAERALKAAASKDKSQRVQLATRRFLVIDKVSVDDLRQQLRDDREAVRADAAEALSLRISGAARYDLIKAAMCDNSARVRSAALRGLGRVSSKLTRGVLRNTMYRDSDKNVRRTAMVMYILAGGR